MQLIPSGVPVPVEVTFDANDLYVGLSVFDMSTGAPVAVGALFPMVNVPGSNSYAANFTPVNGKPYVFLKRVFTDNTYTVPDVNYGTGSDSAYATNLIQETALILAGVPSFSTQGGLIGFCYQDEIVEGPLGNLDPVEIIQGSKGQLNCKFLRKASRDPFDLTGVTDIQVCFANDDGTELQLSLLTGGITIVGNPVIGLFSISLTRAQTLALAVDDHATLQVGFVVAGGDPEIFSIPAAYTIIASTC